MKTITVGFSKPSKWKPFSWLIMKAYNIPFSHVYVKFTSDKYQRDLIYQASGAMVNFMGTIIWNSHNQIVEEFPVNISDENYYKLMQFCIDNAGKPYSIKDVVGLGIVRLAELLGKKINNPLSDGDSGYVCCELAAYILKDFAGMELEDLDTTNPLQIYIKLKAIKNG